MRLRDSSEPAQGRQQSQETLPVLNFRTQVSHHNLMPPKTKTLGGASLVAQIVKNPPAMRETWVPSLGWEDHLEKGKASQSSILA